jgi:hypothetical protein
LKRHGLSYPPRFAPAGVRVGFKSYETRYGRLVSNKRAIP